MSLRAFLYGVPLKKERNKSNNDVVNVIIHLRFLLAFSTSPFSFWYFSVLYTSSQVRPR